MSTERGRPRSFDIDTALDQATQVFWRLGFQGASMAELTAATGLSKPSLYAAFGDKESLYLKCLQRYVEHQVGLQTALLEQEPDHRTAVATFLRTMAAMQADPKLPGGCFVVNGTADCGSPGTPCRPRRLKRRLAQAERDGALPPGTDAKGLATLFSTVLTGMAVMSKGGQPKQRLDEVVDAALLAWPPAPRKARRGSLKAG